MPLRRGDCNLRRWLLQAIYRQDPETFHPSGFRIYFCGHSVWSVLTSARILPFDQIARDGVGAPFWHSDVWLLLGKKIFQWNAKPFESMPRRFDSLLASYFRLTKKHGDVAGVLVLLTQVRVWPEKTSNNALKNGEAKALFGLNKNMVNLAVHLLNGRDPTLNNVASGQRIRYW